MYPKSICRRYECKLDHGIEIKVLELAESGSRKPSQFIAIILASDEGPEQLEADSFDDVVTQLAKMFNEPEDNIHTALVASAAKQGRTQAVVSNRSFLRSVRRRIGGRH